MIFLSRDAAPEGSSELEVSKAGRERGHPKKGRGTSGGFRGKFSPRTGVSAGRSDQTTREPSGKLVGRSGGLLARGSCKMECDA